MSVQLSYWDVTKEIYSVKGSSFTSLPLKELAQILKIKRSSQDILRYLESKPTTQAMEEREIEWLIYSLLLHEIFCYPEQEKKTYTSEIPIESEEYYSLFLIRRVFEQEQEAKELEQEALFVIAIKFGKIEKVKSIYVQRYREELQIQVLLSTNQYESDLMDTLLDIEYDIRKMFPEIVFEFFYPPAGISEKKDFIHPQAECIYMR